MTMIHNQSWRHDTRQSVRTRSHLLPLLLRAMQQVRLRPDSSGSRHRRWHRPIACQLLDPGLLSGLPMPVLLPLLAGPMLAPVG